MEDQLPARRAARPTSLSPTVHGVASRPSPRSLKRSPASCAAARRHRHGPGLADHHLPRRNHSGDPVGHRHHHLVAGAQPAAEGQGSKAAGAAQRRSSLSGSPPVGRRVTMPAARTGWPASANRQAAEPVGEQGQRLGRRELGADAGPAALPRTADIGSDAGRLCRRSGRCRRRRDRPTAPDAGAAATARWRRCRPASPPIRRAGPGRSPGGRSAAPADRAAAIR